MTQSDTLTEISIKETSTEHEAKSSSRHKWAWEEMKSIGISRNEVGSKRRKNSE